LGPVQAITTCFRKFFITAGRASRSEFWWFYLIAICAVIAAEAADILVFGPSETIGIFAASVVIATFLPSFTVSIRRLHDTGKSLVHYFAVSLGSFAAGIAVGAIFAPQLGEYAGTVSGLVIISGYLVIFYWFIAPSHPNANKYGPNPYEVTP